MGWRNTVGGGRWHGRGEHAPAARPDESCDERYRRTMNRKGYDDPRMIDLNALPVFRIVGIAILVFVIIVLASSGTYIVKPGYRGVAVTLGKVSPAFKPEGFGFKQPFIT